MTQEALVEGKSFLEHKFYNYAEPLPLYFIGQKQVMGLIWIQGRRPAWVWMLGAVFPCGGEGVFGI